MTWKRYAGIVGEDVFTIFSFEADGSSNEYGPRLEAGMSSDPVFKEIPSDLDVSPGWTYDGSTFTPPVEGA
jgi:hypothetical protein